MELRHLQYFLMVARELHYRKAAEKLFISQPGLSRQIKQLEEILEVPLFIRDKRNVKLTAAGEYLKQEIEFIFNHLEITKQNIKMINAGEEGEIRIGFVGSAMQNVIPDRLVKMNEVLPKVHASLDELSNSVQLEAVMKDQLDIGFVRLTRTPEGIVRKPVLEDTFSVVLPKKHKLNHKTFMNVKQLKDENFILFSSDYSSEYFEKIVSICEDQGFSPKVSHRSIHAQTIFKLVESNLGVAIVPSSFQHGFDLDIKFLELKNIKQKAVLSMIWKKGNRNPVLKNVLRLWAK